MAIGKIIGPSAGFPITVAGKTVWLTASVQVDSTGAEVSAGGGGLTNTELRATPVPISGTVAVTGAGDATAANQATQITAEQAILAKIIAAPATEAKQDTIIGHVDGIETALTAANASLDAIEAVPAPITSANFLANLRSGTATPTNVNSQTAAITILASNAARKGGKIINTDANALYLVYQAFGAGTPSATNYYEVLATGDDHVIDSGYTGEIAGAWAADGAGKAMVWEIT